MLLRRFATQKLDILGARYEFRIDQRFLKYKAIPAINGGVLQIN
jgi:hypothetical protein